MSSTTEQRTRRKQRRGRLHQTVVEVLIGLLAIGVVVSAGGPLGG